MSGRHHIRNLDLILAIVSVLLAAAPFFFVIYNAGW